MGNEAQTFLPELTGQDGPQPGPSWQRARWPLADGGEAMIPALEAVIKYGGALGVREIVYGMAHRGRLNVLANVMAKPYRVIVQ